MVCVLVCCLWGIFLWGHEEKKRGEEGRGAGWVWWWWLGGSGVGGEGGRELRTD